MAVSLLAVCYRSSAAPGFWQAATQADFLRGDVDQLSVDEHGRLTLGPELTPRSRHRRAVRVDGARGGRRRDVSRHRQRRQGDSRRSQRPGHGVLTTAARWKCTRWRRRRRARLYVGTSPDGRIYKVDAKGQATTVLRSGRQIHLVARRGSQRQRLRRDRRQGHRLQDFARRQRRRSFSRPRPCTPCRWRSMPNNQLLVGTGSPGPRVPRRWRGQGLPAARHAPTRKSTPFASIPRA